MAIDVKGGLDPASKRWTLALEAMLPPGQDPRPSARHTYLMFEAPPPAGVANFFGINQL